jgi:hypothetical protein
MWTETLVFCDYIVTSGVVLLLKLQLQMVGFAFWITQVIMLVEAMLVNNSVFPFAASGIDYLPIFGRGMQVGGTRKKDS